MRHFGAEKGKAARIRPFGRTGPVRASPRAAPRENAFPPGDPATGPSGRANSRRKSSPVVDEERERGSTFCIVVVRSPMLTRSWVCALGVLVALWSGCAAHTAGPPAPSGVLEVPTADSAPASNAVSATRESTDAPEP